MDFETANLYDLVVIGGSAGGLSTAISSLRSVERMPSAGSPRIEESCDVPGLRVQRVPGFPCGWFNLVRVDHVDVVRLLAYTQDLVTILGGLDHDE